VKETYNWLELGTLIHSLDYSCVADLLPEEGKRVNVMGTEKYKFYYTE
jgi:hypothetical protein